uniref:Uncharacterized protein LOC111115705 n=1 Tax=Crassostrea virginica TaxID=6565 RepID=A0A8B8C564_CRAVI|nr:uncharacterized protein LOC111115705 [Crassostrea virginica]
MKAFLVIFCCGLIQLVTGSCKHLPKEEENTNLSKTYLPKGFLSMLQGCKYKGKEIESGQLELFPEECGFCSCSPEGDLMCCSMLEEIDRSTVPEDCTVKQEGCKQRVVLKADETKPCIAEVAVVGRK